jgi:hypothetical protein
MSGTISVWYLQTGLIFLVLTIILLSGYYFLRKKTGPG